MQLYEAVTRLSTAAVRSLRLEDVGEAEVMCLAESSKPPHAPRAAPVDSQHSIQGTPTTRVLDHAHTQEASHHQRHTNPITEKERVQPPNETSRAAQRHPKGERARGPCAAAAKTAQRLAED